MLVKKTTALGEKYYVEKHTGKTFEPKRVGHNYGRLPDQTLIRLMSQSKMEFRDKTHKEKKQIKDAVLKGQFLALLRQISKKRFPKGFDKKKLKTDFIMACKRVNRNPYELANI